MSGWVKIHRQLLDWEWYSDINVCRVFTHLLLTVNYKDKKWQGIKVERGSTITSIDNLAVATSLTKQQVRTVLKKLESSREITLKSTNKYTLIKLVNFNVYQEMEIEEQQTNNKRITNEQQTNNKRITTTKELKNLRTKELKNLRTKEVDQDLIVATPKVATTKFANDSVEMLTSKYLADKILKLSPNAKVPQKDADLQKWAKHVDLMLRVDKRTVEELKDVLKFATNDTFWQSKILSTKKLREKYDQLYLIIIEKERTIKNNGNYTRNFKNDDEYSAIKSFKL